MSVQLGVNDIIYFMEITAPLYYPDYNIIIILVYYTTCVYILYTKSKQIYDAHKW